jgi:ribosomal protein S18 acetylase RimI-like enzyme
MSIELPLAPSRPELAWRSLTAADAAALAVLEMPASGATRGANALGGFTASGQLAACAWLEFDPSFKHEQRIYLHEHVRPEQAEAGDVGLGWLEARARQIFAEQRDGRPQVLRIDFSDQRPAALARYERHGFSLAAAEDLLGRDLSQPIPDLTLPAPLRYVTWDPDRSAAFHAVYQAAFRERPGFPDWSEELWRGAFIEHAEFLAEHSLLVLDGTVGVAYVVCAVDDNPEAAASQAWINQIGVHPDYRSRRLGSVVLAEVLRRFRAAGFQQALLDVNVNNPRARRVYEQLGFTLKQRFCSYRKIM